MAGNTADNRISVQRTTSYDRDVVLQALREHFRLLQIDRLLRPGMRVLLKPNLLIRRTPEEATTTHPVIIESIAVVLQEFNITDIWLADSPGGPYSRTLVDSVYSGTGMKEAAANSGVRLNHNFGWQERHSESPDAFCQSFNIINPAVEADFIINLPKLKTHAMTTLSAGVKNLFGCIPGLQKPEFHFRFPDKSDFSRMLVDLSLVVKPGLTIVDAVQSMEGDGPSAGMPKETGYTFAACNLHALDLALCGFMGLPVAEVHTVSHAIALGLCPTDTAELEYLGDGKPDKTAFQPPATRTISFSSGRRVPKIIRPAVRWMEKRLAPRPVIRKADCIGCGKCAESCAPDAIVMQDKKAQIDRGKCIRCFCCHEMCPVKAIDIHRSRILDL